LQASWSYSKYIEALEQERVLLKMQEDLEKNSSSLFTGYNARGSGHKLEHRNFHSNMHKNCTVRVWVMEHWHRLPREIEESLSLEPVKTCPAVYLCSLL